MIFGGEYSPHSCNQKIQDSCELVSVSLRCVTSHRRGSSVLTNCRGVGRLLNSVWECHYSQTRVSSEFQSRQGHLWVVGQTSLHVGCQGQVSPGGNFCWRGNSVLHCRWAISNVLDHPLCSKTDSQITICLLWPRCSHCCPQRNCFSPADVSGLQILDLRNWSFSVVYKSFHKQMTHTGKHVEDEDEWTRHQTVGDTL